MNAAVRPFPVPEQEQEPETVTAYDKTRLALAGRIAAGLCANPHVCTQQSWRGAVARDALQIADNLLLLVTSGGC